MKPKFIMPCVTAVIVVMAASCTTKKSQNPDVDTSADTISYVQPLHVNGKALVNADGDTIVLTGPSFGWHNNWGRFYNAGTVEAIKKDWGANITRAAIGAHDSGDCTGNYDADPERAVSLAKTVIDAAIDNDMYIICDWHSHNNTLDNAKAFFAEIAGTYGDCPNILYEIWNEPTEIEWQEIKDYASEVIPVIRRNAPNSIVIVGTPLWDQQVDLAAANPIDEPNLLYALHFYATSHTDWLRDRARNAIDAGLPVIISECGSMENTGDGPIDYDSWNAWIELADRNNLSVLMWDIADKDETCSMLVSTAPDNGMQWQESDLKEWGKLARHTTRKRNGIE